MEKEELQKLFKKYHEGNCTEEEKALLESWYLKFNEHDVDISSNRINAIGKRIFRELPGNHDAFIKIGLRLAVAATTFGILFMLTLKYLITSPNAQNITYSKEIPPGTNTAILTLAGGQKIDLSTAGTGRIANQTGIQIYKTANGQISYQSTADLSANDIATTNNITTPKGGQWQITLPDGSKVWLNSASSFSYPASFKNQKNRVVQLNGEAYFEVAKDRAHPFIVKSHHQSVEVLGTHFNINAYEDEPAIKTTLLQGSVKVNVSGDSNTVLLKPGEQATVTSSAVNVKAADPDEAIAWKNGYFQFDNEPIASVMRKLARWYAVDIAYDGTTPVEGLTGRIARNNNISQVIKALEATKTVHLKVEGRRIMVMR